MLVHVVGFFVVDGFFFLLSFWNCQPRIARRRRRRSGDKVRKIRKKKKRKKKRKKINE